ncbi:MAG: hypothetical protein M3R38_10340 [Actinomycetota bacterium]|nr:hypothetical protein [Actinomycetota bacterium]
MESGDLRSPGPPPTPEEFDEARQRELARLNFRIGSMTGRTFHTPEDAELLEGDTEDRRAADMAAVRRWTENSPGHGGGAKTA